MTGPIVLEFDVDASPEHAFEVWTRHCGTWWPPSHSMSGRDDFEVVFEPFVGGRVFEQSADGTEYEWGEVTVWDPPERLEYLWHIFLDREKATKVSVTFAQSGDGSVVKLENSGFDVFGEGAGDRRERVGSAWVGITDRYREELGSTGRLSS